MKRIISLILVLVILVGTIPTFVSAASDSSDWWRQYKDKGGSGLFVRKNGDWDCLYSRSRDLTKLDTIVYSEPELLGVCGYSGKESDITIPTEINGAPVRTLYYFHMPDSVKTLRIPKEIKYITPLDSTESWDYSLFGRLSKSLEEIIVEDNHEYFTKDGVLYRRWSDSIGLVLYPPAKKNKTFTVPSFVTYIDSTFSKNLTTLTITENVRAISYSFPKSLKKLYFKNVKLTPNNLGGTIDDSGDRYYIKTYGATVYCIKDSALYKAYKSGKKISCKELKALSKPKTPEKATIKSISFSKKKKAVKLTLKKQNCYGFKVYRYSSKTKTYKYIGYTHSSVYYDNTVKSGKTYRYKVRAYNKKNLIKKNGAYSKVSKLKVTFN